MLTIQLISLQWDKLCRGAPYTTQRNRMAQADVLPDAFYNNGAAAFTIHYSGLWQDQGGINKVSDYVKRKFDRSKIRVGAVEIIREDEGYRIDYHYAWHGGCPPRQKYDVQTRHYVSLCETAMILRPGEYGRVIYNGRFQNYEDCYYKLEIINIINDSGGNSVEVFVNREPDYNYRQIAHLF